MEAQEIHGDHEAKQSTPRFPVDISDLIQPPTDDSFKKQMIQFVAVIIVCLAPFLPLLVLALR